MGTHGSIHVRGRTVLAAIALLALAALPAVVWESRPEHHRTAATRPPDPRYATQSSDRTLTRRQHLSASRDEGIDGALETCAGLGVGYFAERFGVAADPKVVARHFAKRFEPAYQKSAYEGCLEGLLHGG